MPRFTLAVFVIVYAGMLLGGLPRLRLDRTGVALLGAIALLAAGAVTPDQAVEAIDVPTLALLFGLMVLSAQLRLGGFYTWVTRGLTRTDPAPLRLLAIVIGVSGVLAAIFSNDIICLAMAPVLIDVCHRRRLNPYPFLIGLAAAANVGSAATLIGNPQNMLIGQRLSMSFVGYLGVAGPIALVSLAATWAVMALVYRGDWTVARPVPEVEPAEVFRPFNRWQTTKGLTVAAALVVVFLQGDVPGEIAALAAAGLLLSSRELQSREMLGLIDWPILVFFMGLFVVNHALQMTTYPAEAIAALTANGLDPASPGWLFVVSVVLSNAISNVPAVMLLLPLVERESAAVLLAIASTLAGNLLLVGSVANLIVADAAERQGLPFDWARHARAGVPITVVTLAVAAIGLWVAS